MVARNRVERFRHGQARRWATGVAASVIFLAALVAGSEYGKIHGSSLNSKLIAWISAAVVLVAGVIATDRLSGALAGLFSDRSVPGLIGAVRVVSAAVGALIVIFSVLAVLEVSIEHLLVGAGLAGVVLGIAAQQSLGNVFAGFVLVFARPFAVGDRIRIRSGALGGIFDARVLEMSLTYVTLRTDDGVLKIPNSAMLAAGVGHPRPGAAPPAAPGAAAVPGAAAAGSAPAGAAPAGAAPAGAAPAGLGAPEATAVPGAGSPATPTPRRRRLAPKQPAPYEDR